MVTPERLALDNLPQATILPHDQYHIDLPQVLSPQEILTNFLVASNLGITPEDRAALNDAATELIAAYQLGAPKRASNLTEELETIRYMVRDDMTYYGRAGVAPILSDMSALIRKSVQFDKKIYDRLGREFTRVISNRDDLYVTGMLRPDLRWGGNFFGAPLIDVAVRRQRNHFKVEPIVRGLDGQEGLLPFSENNRAYSLFGVSVLQALPAYEKKSLMHIPLENWTLAEVQAAEEDGFKPSPDGTLLQTNSA